MKLKEMGGKSKRDQGFEGLKERRKERDGAFFCFGFLLLEFLG
jgi:hypothetical protein